MSSQKEMNDREPIRTETTPCWYIQRVERQAPETLNGKDTFCYPSNVMIQKLRQNIKRYFVDDAYTLLRLRLIISLKLSNFLEKLDSGLKNSFIILEVVPLTNALSAKTFQGQ